MASQIASAACRAPCPPARLFVLPACPTSIVAGYDATAAVPQDLKLVEDKGPAGFVFQTISADPTRRGIYGHFNPPCNVTWVTYWLAGWVEGVASDWRVVGKGNS